MKHEEVLTRNQTCWTSSSILVLGVLLFFFTGRSSPSEISEFSSFPLVFLTGAFSLLLVIFNWLVGDFTLLLCTVVFLSSLVLEATRLVCKAAAVGSGGLAIGLTSRSSAQCVLCLTSCPFSCDPTSGPHFRPLCFAWLLVPILDALTVLVVLAAHLLDILLVCAGDGAFEKVMIQSI